MENFSKTAPIVLFSRNMFRQEYFCRFLQYLQSRCIIADREKLDVDSAECALEKAIRLFCALRGRSEFPLDSDFKAITALFKLFAECFIFTEFSIRIKNLEITFRRRKQKLTEFVPEEQQFSILSEFINQASVDDFMNLVDICRKAQGISLVRDTVPCKNPTYLPRLLTRRINISPKLFLVDSTDIFVFTDISWTKLRSYVGNANIKRSRSQLSGKTTRFILLNEKVDWRYISRNSSVPAHLIKYESSNSTFYLEDTTGGSTLIHRFLVPDTVSMYTNKTEDELVNPDEHSRGACICDSPGMGKTYILEALAKAASEKLPSRTVAYFSLVNLAPKLKIHKESSLFLDDWIIRVLVDNLTTLKFSGTLLSHMLNNKLVELDLFFDALDEVQPQDKEMVIIFLKQVLKQFVNSRVYITSRKHVRHEAEKILGMMSYELQPFDETLQRMCLISFWEHNNYAFLKEETPEHCAQNCINSLTVKTTFGLSDAKFVMETPLLCTLVAEIYAAGAAKYATIKTASCTHNLTDLRFLHQIYGMILKKRLEISSCHAEPFTQVMQPHRNFDTSYQVFTFHVGYALQTIIPMFAIQACQYMQVSSISEMDILAPGILEKDSENQQKGFKFVHRRFAEYLVAQFFARAILAKEPKSKLHKIALKFLLQELFDVKPNVHSGRKPADICMSSAEEPSANDFKHKAVVYFLNSILIERKINVIVHPEMFQFLEPVLPAKFCSLLEIVLKNDCSGILCFLLTYASGFWFNTRWSYGSYFNCMEGEFNRATNLVILATRSNNLDSVCSVFKFFVETLGVYISAQPKCMSSDCLTFLDVAATNCNIEILEFFIGSVSLDNTHVLYYCAANTYDLEDHCLGKRLAITKMLLRKYPALIHDSYFPLLAPKIHPYLIKCLVNSGADIGVSRDSYNLVHIAAEFMTENYFLELCSFVITECDGQYLFQESPRWFNPLWYIILHLRNFSIVILKQILSFFNQEDRKQNCYLNSVLLDVEIFHVLCHTDKTIIRNQLCKTDVLYNTHADIFYYILAEFVYKQDFESPDKFALDFENKSTIYQDFAILCAAKQANLDIFRLLKLNETGLFKQDKLGNNILHIAAMSRSYDFLRFLIRFIDQHCNKKEKEFFTRYNDKKGNFLNNAIKHIKLKESETHFLCEWIEKNKS